MKIEMLIESASMVALRRVTSPQIFDVLKMKKKKLTKQESQRLRNICMIQA